MNCKECEERELPERYLLGRLSDSERDDFEQHYFECASCFSELQTKMAIRDELLRQPLVHTHEHAGFFSHSWAWALASVAILLLLAAGLRWYSGRKQQTQSPVVSNQHPNNPEPRQPSTQREAPLDELARVQPPPYKPVVLRGVEDQAHEQFQQAMQHYLQGEYKKAIPGLQAAVQDSPQSARFGFYLGVCYLLIGETDSAIESLQRVISLGDQLYAKPAHFYLAKAYLQKKDIGAAVVELQATIRLRDSNQAEAAEILHRLGK